jgi:hypothetical protein
LYYGIVVNWIATNIRFPEDQYMELKMEAARRRKSLAALVRGQVPTMRTPQKKTLNVEKIMRKFDRLAKENAKYMKGIILSEALIRMRYEQ